MTRPDTRAFVPTSSRSTLAMCLVAIVLPFLTFVGCASGNPTPIVGPPAPTPSPEQLMSVIGTAVAEEVGKAVAKLEVPSPSANTMRQLIEEEVARKVEGLNMPTPLEEMVLPIIEEAVANKLLELGVPPLSAEAMRPVIQEEVAKKLEELELRNPSTEELLAVIRQVVEEKREVLRGPFIDVKHRQRTASFNTSSAKQWQDLISLLPFNLERSSKIVVIATGDITFEKGKSAAFKVGIEKAVKRPKVIQEYKHEVAASVVENQDASMEVAKLRTAFALSRVFEVEPGEISIHFLAYNVMGEAVIENVMLTVFIVERMQ